MEQALAGKTNLTETIEDENRCSDYYRLIALLLGRLRLSVSEAITEYRTLSEQVFSVRKASGKDGTFKASNLERAIKEVITRKLGEGHAEDTMWQDGGCKTYDISAPV